MGEACVPIRFDQFQRTTNNSSSDVGIEDHEVVELASAFRLYGFWRIDLDSGHFFGTRDIFKIFDMEYRSGPINLVEFVDHLHPEDRPMLMESFERTSTLGYMHHNIYRVRAKNSDEYKYVRTVGKYRHKPGTSGEIIGITYEFFERLRTAAFCETGEMVKAPPPLETGADEG